MPSTAKQIIAVIITLVCLVMIYFGAYLPLRQAQLYIAAMVGIQQGQVHSLDDFLKEFKSVLDFRSPVGHDEVISFCFDLLANVVNKQTDALVIKSLMNEAENWMAPILAKGKGFTFSQNLYNFAMIYKIAGQKLKDEIYLEKSLDLFKKGQESSPGRLIFLAGLFELHWMKGNSQKVREIGETILEHWPDKEVVRKIMDEL